MADPSPDQPPPDQPLPERAGPDQPPPDPSLPERSLSGRSLPERSRPDHSLPDHSRAERSVEDVLWSRVERKRGRIRAEIERNRAGGHKIPTWVLAAILGLILLGWLLLILTS